MGTRAAGVDDALGDALAVEMGDFLDELIVLEGRRATLADRAGRLIVANRMALAGREDVVLVGHGLLREGEAGGTQDGPGERTRDKGSAKADRRLTSNLLQGSAEDRTQ